jgi:spore coat polysaccharide biosynthesis predicted glycosyltransferase SpsG
MKAFIFIPDTNKSAGLGHLFRCYQYSNFVKSDYKIIFLIQKSFEKNYLKSKNARLKKINYIFFSDLKKILTTLKKKYEINCTFLDSYNSKFHSINFNTYSKKHIAILDFKIKNNAKFILDHTFRRRKNFHKIKIQKNLYIGHKNFPIFKKISLIKRKTILIDFGSIKNKKLILKSLLFLKNLNLNLSFRIIVINKFFNKKDISRINILNEVICYKFFNNIHKIYKDLFFAIGACGISLYEKCFYHIPTIAKSVARNQNSNFRNFSSVNCILDFDIEIKTNLKNSISIEKFFNRIKKTERKLKKYFNYNKNKIHLNNFFKKL